jgi:hypothetical protein
MANTETQAAGAAVAEAAEGGLLDQILTQSISLAPIPSAPVPAT